MYGHIEVLGNLLCNIDRGRLEEIIDKLTGGARIGLYDVYITKAVVSPVMVNVNQCPLKSKIIEALAEPLFLSTINGKDGIELRIAIEPRGGFICAWEEPEDLRDRILQEGGNLLAEPP